MRELNMFNEENTVEQMVLYMLCGSVLGNMVTDEREGNTP